jgi:hypothetical protein
MIQNSPVPRKISASEKTPGLSILMVVLAALFWGLSGGIGGILTGRGWEPVLVSFYRGITGLLFVSVWLAMRPHGSGLSSIRLWL